MSGQLSGTNGEQQGAQLTCGIGDETAGRVEREAIERLTTLQHPSVSIHGRGSETSVRSRKTKVGDGENGG